MESYVTYRIDVEGWRRRDEVFVIELNSCCLWSALKVYNPRVARICYRNFVSSLSPSSLFTTEPEAIGKENNNESAINIFFIINAVLL